MKSRIAIAAAAAVVIVGPRMALADDFATITQRVISQLLSNAPGTSTAQGYMNSMAANGSWSDVDYGSTAQTNWSPLTHVQRMEAMAQAYANTGGSLYHNATLAADLSKAMDYWVAANPTSTNWFDNDIAAPQALGAAMVLSQPVYSSSQISSGQTLLARAKNAIPSYTGQNVVDLSIPGIYSAIVANSSSAMTTAFGTMNGTVFVSNFGTDGIQADHTYHIHDVQLYMGGYGSSYINDMTQWAALSAGTQYALTTTQLHTLVDYLLDGTQWFIRGQTLDLAANGRQVTFPSYVGAGDGYSGAIQNALNLGGYRTAELQAFLARQQATQSSGTASTTANTLTGNRAFFNSDAMVQQRPGWYASVKVTSTRTSNPESGNSQGLKNLYLGDGVNQIMVTGNEYLGIQPVWNWYRLPGTTTEQDGRSLKPATDWGVVHGTTTYAGGVSDGKYGAEGFDYSRYDVKAKKSWFFFDNEQVALGNTINTTSTSFDTYTTLNQCLLTGTVSYESSGGSVQTMATGTVTPANLKWVNQGGVGYFFITPVSNATIAAVSQTGNWSALNTAASGSVTSNVFSLYINHGKAVTNGSYAYIAVPGLTVGQMDSYLSTSLLSVLRNDSTAQAVRQGSLNMTQATFYAAGSVTISGTQTFAASAPSAVILQNQPNTLKISAASPQAKQMGLNVTMNAVNLANGGTWFDALGTATAAFNLPGGNTAGSTVGLTLTNNAQASPTVSLSSNDGVTQSSYTVTGPVSLPAATTFQEDSFASLGFTGAISGSGSLTQAGPGKLTLSGANTYTGTTAVKSGTMIIGVNARGPILTGGGADIQGGQMQLTYAVGASPVTTIKPLIDASAVTHFTTGQFRGTTLLDGQTLGYRDDGNGTITVLPTLPGDANLDGRVDFSDFLLLQANFGTAGTRFDQGNFNYDGATNFSDFLLLQANFGQSINGTAVTVTAAQVTAMQAFARAADVPEPQSLIVFAAGTLLVKRRRP